MNTSITLSSSNLSNSLVTGWYSAAKNVNLIDPAREAYDEAIKLFNARLTGDECKRVWLSDKNSIEHVQNAVLDAKKAYDKRSQHSKAHKWLSKLSSRVIHYGNIMDILAQHHPEYTALVWGTMKFLFVAMVNQGELIAQLSKALSQIADALPRIEIKNLLYPTEMMKSAVATLYAYIIKFCQRAVGWYTEGKLKHVLTSITRPSALRFKDIVEEIAECSRRVDNLAVASAQAEQRDMHLLLQRVERMMIANQSINLESHLDTNRRVCEIQFSQILTFTASTTLLDPEESFRYSIAMSNRRRSRRINDSDPIWKSPKMQAWASARGSSLTMIKGNSATRHQAKDFAADMVHLLRTTNTPTVWVLNTSRETSSTAPTTIDVLKQITLQVLKINSTLLDERSLSLNAARFQSACSESDWFNLLSSALTGLPLIYIVIDIDTVTSTLPYKFCWLAAFYRLFEDLSTRGIFTPIKVILISYGAVPLVFSGVSSEKMDECIINIAKKPSSRRFARVAVRKRGVGALRPLLVDTIASA